MFPNNEAQKFIADIFSQRLFLCILLSHFVLFLFFNGLVGDLVDYVFCNFRRICAN